MSADRRAGTRVLSDDRQSSARERHLFKGIATLLASRGVAALAPLALIPITLSYLGPAKYGLWMAITSATAMAAFADLGLGNGLMTKLSEKRSAADTSEARQLISTAYTGLTMVSLALCGSLWAALHIVQWDSVFNTAGSLPSHETSVITSICLTAFILNIPLALVTRIQYSYHLVAQSGLWQAVGGLIPIPAVAIAAHLDWGAVAVISISVAGLPLVNLANNIYIFTKQLPHLAPRISEFDRLAAIRLLKLGLQFGILTVIMSFATNSDNIIIAQTLGVTAVTLFAVPSRLFAQLGQLVSLINTPLWPANGEALARGDIDWVRRITKRMVIVSSGTIFLLSLPLLYFGGQLLNTWTGTDLHASLALLSGFAVWWILLAGLSPVFMVQNSAGLVAPQLIGWMSYLVISIPLRWVSIPLYGIDGVPWISCLVYSFTVLPAALYGYHRAIGRIAAVPRRLRCSSPKTPPLPADVVSKLRE